MIVAAAACLYKRASSSPSFCDFDITHSPIHTNDSDNTMPVIIDHNKYPEIMTTILSYAPLASLAVLRRTSATFRKRVRRLLFYHVSLVSNNGQDAFVVPPSPASLSLSPGSTVPFRPPHVRVLDVGEDPLALVPSKDTTRALASLRILRRRGKAIQNYCTIKPRSRSTLVDFLDLDDMTDIIVNRVTPTIQPYNYFHRYVLHVQWCDDWGLQVGDYRALRNVCFPGIGNSSIWKIAVVLWPYRTDNSTPNPLSAIEVVYNIVKALDVKFSGQLVIVGIENTRLEVLVKYQKPYRIESAFNAFRQRVEARLRAGDRDSEALDGVMFRTVEEWHAELGEDMEYVGHWVDADVGL